MSKDDHSHAVRRFGLGPRAGDLQAIGGDPRGAVLAQLGNRDAARIDAGDLMPSHVAFAELRAARQEQKQAKEAAKGPPAVTVGPSSPGPVQPPQSPMTEERTPSVAPRGDAKPATNGPTPGEIRREAFRDDASARIKRAIETTSPLIERLVMFWSNHFCVSAAKGPVRVLAGAFEREAIRPHVLGRFGDMLKAVEQHPAMLIYLDNQVSIGPQSKAGISNRKGLNENLGREILELHTLGVGGGYTQADVTNLARLITGWTVGGLNQGDDAGRFLFAQNRHEAGVINVLGKAYDGAGVLRGEACLADLAVHPATARHIATKLARHFVADPPPPALVQRLEAAFRASGGDLAAVSNALVTAPEAWSAPARKSLPPYDYLISIGRGLGLQVPAPEVIRLAAALGQPLWQPPSPAGWPDGDDVWIAPASLRERLRTAERTARLVDRRLDPRAVADDLFGAAMSEDTRRAIAGAETREQGLELVLMVPEFLRR